MGTALFAEHIEQQPGGAIDDSGMAVEFADRTHITAQVHERGHVVHPDGRLDRPDQIQRCQPGLRLRLLDGNVCADDSGQGRAVGLACGRARYP